MRFLLSSLFLLFVSCSSYPKRNGFKEITSGPITRINPYFSDSAKDYIYKANINAYDTTFSGILILKKLGPNHHRIVFTTELGNKVFDFSFNGALFKVNQVLKELDRKLLITILKNDFKVLIKENIFVEKTFISKNDTLFKTAIGGKKHFYLHQAGSLKKIMKVNKGKSSVEFLFSELNDDLAAQIQINHNNIRLSIRLKSI